MTDGHEVDATGVADDVARLVIEDPPVTRHGRVEKAVVGRQDFQPSARWAISRLRRYHSPSMRDLISWPLPQAASGRKARIRLNKELMAFRVPSRQRRVS